MAIDIIKNNTNMIYLGDLHSRLVSVDFDFVPEIKKNNFNIDISGFWIKYEDDIYYFKSIDSSRRLLNELIGEEVSKFLGLDTVHMEIARGFIIWNGQKKEYIGVMSKVALKPDVIYQSFANLKNEIKEYFFTNPTLGILNFLSDRYPHQPINSSFRKFLVRDFFTDETDRIDTELLIAKDKETVDLGFLCDYEQEFMHYIYPKNIMQIPNLFSFDITSIKTMCQIARDPELTTYFKDIVKCDLQEKYRKLIEEKRLRYLDIDDNYYSGYYLKKVKQIQDNLLLR